MLGQGLHRPQRNTEGDVSHRVLLYPPFHDDKAAVRRVERLLEVGDGVLEPPHHQLRRRARKKKKERGVAVSAIRYATLQ